MGPIGPIISCPRLHMKCLDPKLCYTATNGSRQLRHFSLANDLFKRRAQAVFDCGTCLICRKKRSIELAARCVLHSSLYMHNCFLTLTYDESKDGYHNNFDYTDIQKFKKRLRQHCRRQYGKKIEVFNVHEYGKNGKKHWHLIVFNHNFSDREPCGQRKGIKYYASKTLEKLWPFGFHTIGDVSEASAMYQAQYTQKDWKNDNAFSDKKAHSKHSGIGRPYFLQHYKQILTLGYVPFAGRKLPVPRYFEKLAHKHFCHYYDQSAFFDTSYRKKKYTMFDGIKNVPNLEIADLYKYYDTQKELRKEELAKEWNDVLNLYLETHDKPEFQKSGENALYDLRNKNSLEKF